MRVIVTGASGFVGRQLVSDLIATNHEVVAVVRKAVPDFPPQIEQVLIRDIAERESITTISDCAAGADVVIHLAAATPAKSSRAQELNRVNAAATSELAKLAAIRDVKQFILLSSANVCANAPNREMVEGDADPRPADAYARSKVAAETAVRQCEERGMKWTIIRPPLVYGPRVAGSLSILAKAVRKGIPLPFAGLTTNRRDMIGVTNLSSFVLACLGNPKAHDQVFLVRDGEAISTRQLVEKMAAADKKRAILFKVPPGFFTYTSQIKGASSLIEKLVGDYRINDAKARHLIAGQSPLPMEFDLARMMGTLV